MYLILLTFIIAFTTTYFVVPLVNKFGKNRGLFDYPNSRNQHRKPIVRIGGLALIIGILLTILIIPFISYDSLKIIFLNNHKFITLIFCAFLFFIIGFLDDLKRKSPYLRLFLQFIAASICFSGGIFFDISYLFPSLIESYSSNFLDIVNFLFTTFYIVGLTNAVNWWDGLDGLASGTILISLVLLFILNINVYGLIVSQDNIIIACLSGSSLGFLIHNYKPAKIIMGDGGAYFLGFCLSALTLFNQGYSLDNAEINLPITVIKILPIFVSFSFLLDMTKVIIIRFTSSKLPFTPDRLHLHHNLLFLGFTEEKVVRQIYSIVFTLSLLPLIILKNDYLLFKFGFLFCAIILFSFFNLKKK